MKYEKEFKKYCRKQCKHDGIEDIFCPILDSEQEKDCQIKWLEEVKIPAVKEKTIKKMEKYPTWMPGVGSPDN